MKATKTSSISPFIRIANYRGRSLLPAVCVATLIGLASVLSLQATVLDNFNAGAASGWTDTLNSGTVVQSGGVYTITTSPSSGALTYSRKTGSSFSVAPGNSLEFRADVITVTSGGTAPLKILGWVTTGGALLTDGYSLAVSPTDVFVYKGGSVLTNITGLSLQNSDLTLALRMTGAGSAVTINARVYKRVGNGVINAGFNTIAEATVVDSSGLLTAGNAALGVKSQSAGAASVAYDTLQVLNTTTTTLDAFNSSTLDTSKWVVFMKNPPSGSTPYGGDSVTATTSGLDVLATIYDTLGGFAGVYSTGVGRTFSITDGGQVEFQLDIVNDFGNGGDSSYAALGFLPVASTTYIYGIIEYHIAADNVGTTVIVNGKGYNQWWGGGNTIQPPMSPPGSRFIMTMTGESGNNCRIETRIEDLSVTDVNSPSRVVYQNEFVDTPANDPGLNETLYGNGFPYIAAAGITQGRFSISCFNSGAFPSPWPECLFSNAVVRITAPPPAPPVLANIFPPTGTNFFTNTSVVSFDVSDANPLPIGGMSVTLNGVTYANGSGGVTITPGGSSTSQHFALAGALANNVNYLGSVQATNSLGLVSSSPLIFDTFLTNVFTVEVEDYNFVITDQATFTNAGSYIDNPIIVSDGFNDPQSYNTRIGLAEVDFHDNRGGVFDPVGFSDANHTFRNDYPYNSHSLDNQRAAYVNAFVPESEVNDVYDGDWLNYTKTYPSGTFNVILRQACYKTVGSLVTLERVTNPTVASQTSAMVGTFAETPTGLGLFQNVPLTDGAGTPMILRLGGVSTLRLHDWVTGNADLDTGSLNQNYMAFVPVADPGTLRPVLALALPLANTLEVSAAATTTAWIANRDTTVVVGSIGMTINGAAVAVTASPTNNGAYAIAAIPAPLPPPGSTITNKIWFQDSGSVWTTNIWTYTVGYNYFAASSALPPGSLSTTGFDVRTVKSAAADAALGNSVGTARTMLQQPMPYTVDFTSTNIASVVAWDLTLPGGNGATANFPGLCNPPASGDGFAHEIFAYLHLTAGAHFFHVQSDDSCGVYSGPSLRSDSVTLWEGGSGDFNLVAAADGLYPIHIIYQEGGGAAYLVLTCTDTGSRVVVNTGGAPTAYYPFVVKSSSSPVKGTYTADAAANAGNVMTTAGVPCDNAGAALTQTMTGGTVTVPIPASPKYYLIDGPRPTKITSFKKVGTNVEIKYTGQ